MGPSSNPTMAASTGDKSSANHEERDGPSNSTGSNANNTDEEKRTQSRGQDDDGLSSPDLTNVYLSNSSLSVDSFVPTQANNTTSTPILAPHSPANSGSIVSRQAHSPCRKKDRDRTPRTPSPKKATRQNPQELVSLFEWEEVGVTADIKPSDLEPSHMSRPRGRGAHGRDTHKDGDEEANLFAQIVAGIHEAAAANSRQERLGQQILELEESIRKKGGKSKFVSDRYSRLGLWDNYTRLYSSPYSVSKNLICSCLCTLYIVWV